MRNLSKNQLQKIAEDICLDIMVMHEEGEDISKKVPLEYLMKIKYELSPSQVRKAFRIMEYLYKEDLVLIGYRSFSHWNIPNRFPPDPAFAHLRQSRHRI